MIDKLFVNYSPCKNYSCFFTNKNWENNKFEESSNFMCTNWEEEINSENFGVNIVFHR